MLIVYNTGFYLIETVNLIVDTQLRNVVRLYLFKNAANRFDIVFYPFITEIYDMKLKIGIPGLTQCGLEGRTSESVRRLKRVDLPALVYPTKETTGTLL